MRRFGGCSQPQRSCWKRASCLGRVGSQKSVVILVYIYSMHTGLWVAEPGADTEHRLRRPGATLPTRPWLLCSSVCLMSIPPEPPFAGPQVLLCSAWRGLRADGTWPDAQSASQRAFPPCAHVGSVSFLIQTLPLRQDSLGWLLGAPCMSWARAVGSIGLLGTLIQPGPGVCPEL